MCVHLNEITWETVATIATLIAVVVALIPIWRDALRNKSRARSLRIRLCSKLTIFRPSLEKIEQRDLTKCPAAILSKDEFREAVRSIAVMMQESSVLQPEEQDHLGMAFVNLEMAAPLYDTGDFTSDSAGNILKLIEAAVSIMQKNGLLHSSVEKPWDNQSKTQSSC